MKTEKEANPISTKTNQTCQREINKLKDRVLIIQHAMRIKQKILKSLVSTRDTGQIYQTITHVAKLANADIAYIVLFDNNKLLTVDFYSEDRNIKFYVDPGANEANVPSIARLLDEPCTSVFGSLAFRSSLVFPIKKGNRICGIVELGCINDVFSRETAMILARIHKNVCPSYIILRDYLINLDSGRGLNAQLIQTQKVHEIIFTATHDMVIALSLEGEILDLNNAGILLLGLSEKKARFGTLPLINPSIEFIRSRLEIHDSIADLEVALELHTGKVIFCLASFTAERDARNEVIKIYGIFKNISELIQIQRDLLHANLELSDINQQMKLNQQQMIQQEKLASIGQLAAGIAHEINNPLGFVQSNHESSKKYIKRLLDYIKKVEDIAQVDISFRKQERIQSVIEDLPQVLEESDDGYRRILAIVQGLKNFSHIDAGGALTAIDINQAIQDTMTVARNTWKYVAEIETNFNLTDPARIIAKHVAL